MNRQRTLLLLGRTPIVVATPAAITPTLGAEQLVNPGFEGTYSGGLAPNWTAPVGTPLESADAHGGSKAQQYTGGGSGGNAVYNGYVPVKGCWYLSTAWAKRTATADIRLQFFMYSTTPVGYLDITYDTYTQYVITWRALDTIATGYYAARQQSAGASDTIIIDDASLKAITFTSTIGTVYDAFPNYIAQVAPTLTTGTQAGAILSLDNPANPQNFLLAYHNGVTAYLDQCVAGVYTNLVNGAAAYAAGRVLKVVKSGLSAALYYNNVLIGSSAISPAVAGNRLCSWWNTYAGNSFANFQVARN